MWIAMAFGAYARLRGLGFWPLGYDEYYTLRSVDNILQHGIPAFDCGGYYLRELPVQYLIAPLRLLGLSPELAGRLVPAACSFAVLPAVYLLGKRLSGVTVACIAVGLVSISLWEIEFARFARMYMPFQAVFLWYLLAMHRVVVDRRTSAYGWLWPLSVVGLLTWEGGVFLLVTNFIPHVFERTPARIRHFAVSAGLLILGYVYLSVPFRFMGGPPALPPGLSKTGGSPFAWPHFLAATLPAHPGWLIGAAALLLASLLAMFTLTHVRAAAARERFVWIAVLVLSLLNLFGCVLVVLTLALLLDWLDVRRFSRRSSFIALVPLLANFIFWLAYAHFTHDWYRFFSGLGAESELGKLAIILFKYPDVWGSMLHPWLAAIPNLTIALGGLSALAFAWAVFAKDREHLRGLRLTLAVAVLMVALVGVAETRFTRTRYTFFLLPVLYLLAVTLVYGVVTFFTQSAPRRGLALGLAMLALVATTEDFGWAHMVHMDASKWNFRLPLNRKLTQHYYPRMNIRAIAQFVNNRAAPRDLTITTRPPTTYYLKRVNFVFRRLGNHVDAIACDRGRRARWSGARLLYSNKALFHVIDTAPGDVWFIAALKHNHYPRLQRTLTQRYPTTLIYRGTTGVLGVYKIGKAR